MTSSVSNLALQLLSVNNLQAQEVNLAQLNEQLATGQQHDNLTDYDPTSAHNLMDFQNAITQKQSYLSSMQTVQTRLSLYDQTMTDMEGIASQASSLASDNQSLDPSTVSQLQAQTQVFLKQLTDDLNQQIGGRYIYAGTRYSTIPVTDLTTLGSTAPTWPFTAVQESDTPNLPTYDTQYSGSASVDAAWTSDSVAVDNNLSVQYGITSTNPAFQQLVAGLQFMNAATQPGVSAATYQTEMSHAGSLLTTALSGLQSVHTTLASNQNLLTSETTIQNTGISDLQNQISNLQQVNLTQVGTEINTLQAQLQASYSATASLEQLSILKYL